MEMPAQFWVEINTDWFNLTGMIVGVEFLPLSEMK